MGAVRSDGGGGTGAPGRDARENRPGTLRANRGPGLSAMGFAAEDGKLLSLYADDQGEGPRRAHGACPAGAARNGRGSGGGLPRGSRRHGRGAGRNRVRPRLGGFFARQARGKPGVPRGFGRADAGRPADLDGAGPVCGQTGSDAGGGPGRIAARRRQGRRGAIGAGPDASAALPMGRSPAGPGAGRPAAGSGCPDVGGVGRRGADPRQRAAVGIESEKLAVEGSAPSAGADSRDRKIHRIRRLGRGGVGAPPRLAGGAESGLAPCLGPYHDAAEWRFARGPGVSGRSVEGSAVQPPVSMHAERIGFERRPSR